MDARLVVLGPFRHGGHTYAPGEPVRDEALRDLPPYVLGHMLKSGTLVYWTADQIAAAAKERERKGEVEAKRAAHRALKDARRVHAAMASRLAKLRSDVDEAEAALQKAGKRLEEATEKAAELGPPDLEAKAEAQPEPEAAAPKAAEPEPVPRGVQLQRDVMGLTRGKLIDYARRWEAAYDAAAGTDGALGLDWDAAKRARKEDIRTAYAEARASLEGEAEIEIPLTA